MSRLFASGGQSIGASASVLPMNIQGWFPLGLTRALAEGTNHLSLAKTGGVTGLGLLPGGEVDSLLSAQPFSGTTWALP